MRGRLSEILCRKESRQRIYAFGGMLTNIIWSTIKFAIGCIGGTFFFAISGLHTFFIGVAKSVFYKNYRRADGVKEVRAGRTIAVLTIVSALAFSIYMARLFFIDEEAKYDNILSIAIAAFSFGELGFSIGGLVKSSKKGDLMLATLKGGKLANAFYAIVLTQIAIFAATGNVGMSGYNALAGVLFGLCALATGIGTLLYTYSAAGLRKAVGGVIEEDNSSEAQQS